MASFSSKDTEVTLPDRRARREVDFSTFLPTLVKAIECLGSERSIMECSLDALGSVINSAVFQSLPPGSPIPVRNAAYVSCTSMYVYTSAVYLLLIYMPKLLVYIVTWILSILFEIDTKPAAIRLFNKHRTDSGVEGFVQIWQEKQWNFINGCSWSYPDAMVVCKELGL